MSELLSKDELLAMPLSSVTDGWKLKNGDMYVFVRVNEHLVQTAIIPKER